MNQPRIPTPIPPRTDMTITVSLPGDSGPPVPPGAGGPVLCQPPTARPLYGSSLPHRRGPGRNHALPHRTHAAIRRCRKHRSHRGVPPCRPPQSESTPAAGGCNHTFALRENTREVGWASRQSLPYGRPLRREDTPNSRGPLQPPNPRGAIIWLGMPAAPSVSGYTAWSGKPSLGGDAQRGPGSRGIKHFPVLGGDGPALPCVTGRPWGGPHLPKVWGLRLRPRGRGAISCLTPRVRGNLREGVERHAAVEHRDKQRGQAEQGHAGGLGISGGRNQEGPR